MRTFISYAREDYNTAKQIYDSLKSKGIEPWIDSENLLPGQNWKAEISKAIEECSFFIALLSSNSVTKSGFVQRELKMALDVLSELPSTKIFIIPIRLDPECKPTENKIKNLHWVDLFLSYEKAISKILQVVKPSDIKQRETIIKDQNTTMIKVENFNNFDEWNTLIKIGACWEINENDNVITGSGVYNYLLSYNEYGHRPFNIKIKIRFFNYHQFEKDGIDNGNGGIVLAWGKKSYHPNYLHLLFTGKEIVLEEIGAEGRDEYYDFRNVGHEKPYIINEGQTYSITITVNTDYINVFINERIEYTVKKPDNLLGRIGLRPWRSRIECKNFEITEL